MRRRSVLRVAALSPLAALLAACSGSSKLEVPVSRGDPELTIEAVSTPQAPALVPTAAKEEPFVVAAGEERRAMMAGTPQETPLYIYGSGRPGKIVMVLGGV